MHTKLKTLLAATGIVLATQAAAQITFYEGEGFHGRVFSTDKPIWNFEPYGFNDRARSAIVEHGRWEACEDEQFKGRCIVLAPGSYASLAGMGMSKRISSVRPVDPERHYEHEASAPLAAPTYEYRQRPNEQLYQVPVTSVHAVVGPPEQRCWVEQQQVVRENQPNVPGAIIGGVLGGVLGHQIGSGRGNTVATAVGAVGGAAVGANVNRGTQVTTQDVQRCETVPGSARAEYWDVTYNFQGVEHRMQMSAPPGPTVTVNGNGEPRG